jgi:hypothetical protein
MSHLIVAAPSDAVFILKALRATSNKGLPQKNLAPETVVVDSDHANVTSTLSIQSGSGTLMMGLKALMQAGNVLHGMQLLANRAASDPNSTDLTEQQIMYNAMADQVNILVATATANGVSSGTAVSLANWISNASVQISLSNLDQAAQSLQSTITGLNDNKISSFFR